ncbi:MerR family DNA-binding transcriptional regulator [Candidatus Saccharibacteria bacterium]|nr:MerR family DNA-binding transcriptional regulator [Candidatus Saccharibacteria bacterium]
MTAQRLPENLYTSTEAARLLGVSPTTLRRWEREGRIEPQRTAGGDRRFSQKDIQQILTSFREETDQRREAEPVTPKLEEIQQPPTPPLIPIRAIEDYRPRPKPIASYLLLATLLVILAGGYFAASALPPLTRERLQRAFSPSPLSPIVDVNDIAEYRTKSSGELRLGFKFPTEVGTLFTKSVSVVENAVLNTSRFLGTVFFGKEDSYFITPSGSASFSNVSAGAVSSQEITTQTLSVKNLTVSGTSVGAGGDGGPAEGGDADTLESQPGSYYLAWAGFKNPHLVDRKEVERFTSMVGGPRGYREFAEAKTDQDPTLSIGHLAIE